MNRLAKRAVISPKRVSARSAPVASSRDLSCWRREIARSLSDRSRASEENCFSSSYAVVRPVYDDDYAASGVARARASACDNRASMVRSA